jgi:hypothetical protein
MDEKNVIAARLGLPFKCGVCSQVHEKADLNDEDVCNCFAKAWQSALGYLPMWFSKDGRKLISKPTWDLEEAEYFKIQKIHRTYPIENDVFMLSIPMEKTVENLRKKFDDWETDCLTNGIKLIEENGKLDEVKIENGRLYINGIERIYDNTVLLHIIMKNREVAAALKWFLTQDILDAEWKSLKESAKILVTAKFSGERFTMFASEMTGVVQVPNGINSVREAEEFLLREGKAQLS